MSVTTTADEKLRSAREHISQAYQNILEALNPSTWGSDEYNSEYQVTLHEILMDLYKLEKKL